MTDAERLVEVLKGLQREGRTVMDLIRGDQPAEPWRLYPGEAGVFDRRTRYQFYYHAHGDGREEDGHFHTVRLFADHTVHLVAISMRRDGWPQALFTLNLWAIGDAYARWDLWRYARNFRVTEQAGPPPLVRFVNLIFRAFGPQIDELQEQKFQTLARYRAAHPGRDVFDDRSLEILSCCDVDVRVAAGAPARRAAAVGGRA